MNHVSCFKIDIKTNKFYLHEKEKKYNYIFGKRKLTATCALKIDTMIFKCVLIRPVFKFKTPFSGIIFQKSLFITSMKLGVNRILLKKYMTFGLFIKGMNFGGKCVKLSVLVCF